MRNLGIEKNTFTLLFFMCSSVFAAKPNNEMKEVLDALAGQGGKPIETLSVKEARNQPTPTDAVRSLLMKKKESPKGPQMAEIKNIEIDGAAGKIQARLYVPVGKAPMPVVVYYHGGGFVLASNDVYDATPRLLADHTKCIFLAVEYRKAPEHKFPAAHEDALAAYKWVLKNAKDFNGNPDMVAVAGESAGGNLAANVAIAARDQKLKIPTYQLLIYPVVGSNMETASYRENKDAKPLNKAMMGWFFKQYTSSPADKKDPRLNLMRANFVDLSPATIITAEIDPLRSEGKALADRMRAQGVKVNYKNYNGVTHEFFGMASVLKEAREAQEVASEDLKAAFVL